MSKIKATCPICGCQIYTKKELKAHLFKKHGMRNKQQLKRAVQEAMGG